MPSFSQRQGYKPARKVFQKEFIDDELRTRLWNTLHEIIFVKWNSETSRRAPNRKSINRYLDRVWGDFFKKPLPRPYFSAKPQNQMYFFLRKFVLQDSEWHRLYDFIEFTLANTYWKNFKEQTNTILEQENAAYRIVGNKVTEITDDNEIAEVEQAVNLPFEEVTLHLKQAIDYLADRKSPDYRNSMKESISAVEAMCQRITGDSKATLGKALNKIEGEGIIHPALKKGFSAIYGFTNQAGGIRHALKEGDVTPTYADAKFMLVACSAFTNFLITKATENNVDIGDE